MSHAVARSYRHKNEYMFRGSYFCVWVICFSLDWGPVTPATPRNSPQLHPRWYAAVSHGNLTISDIVLGHRGGIRIFLPWQLTLEPPRKKSRAPPKRGKFTLYLYIRFYTRQTKNSNVWQCSMSSRPIRTEWQFVTAIKLINYVIFVCNVVSLLFMKYKARTIRCLLFIAHQERLYLL